MNFNLPSPIHEIYDFSTGDESPRIFIKRDDLIHKAVSGNKWRKLKYNIANIRSQSKTKILTFGGPFSNHLYACAALCDKEDLKLKCFVRTDQMDDSNPTLKFVKSMGADIVIMDRTTYRQRNDPQFLEAIQQNNPDYYIIPEGGTNQLALMGVAEMVDELEEQIKDPVDFLYVSVGSGGTISGIINKIDPKVNVIGIAAVNDYTLPDKVSDLLLSNNCTNTNWSISFDDSFGGFAKFNDDLIDFANNFYKKHNIKLDPVYTSKLMFAINKRIVNGEIDKNARILAIHTGGLQGIDAFNYLNGNRWLG